MQQFLHLIINKSPESTRTINLSLLCFHKFCTCINSIRIPSTLQSPLSYHVRTIQRLNNLLWFQASLNTNAYTHTHLCPQQNTKELRLNGKGYWGRMDNYICMVESLQCSCETIITVLISYTSIQNGFGVKKKKFFLIF